MENKEGNGDAETGGAAGMAAKRSVYHVGGAAGVAGLRGAGVNKLISVNGVMRSATGLEGATGRVMLGGKERQEDGGGKENKQ